MRTLIATAAILTVAVTQAAAFQGTCLLEVNGHAYIKGPCNIDVMSKDGSFSIGTDEERDYFAYVNLDEPPKAGAQQTADGFWNEEPGVSHAHSPLGSLTRDGACWSNQTAKICAWH